MSFILCLNESRLAPVLMDGASVAIDNEAIDQGIIFGDDVGSDGVGVILLHIANFQPLISLPNEPAFHAILYVVGGEIERLIALNVTPAVVAGCIARAVAVPLH